MYALIFLRIPLLHMGHWLSAEEHLEQVERWPHGSNSMQAGALMQILQTLSRRSRSSS